MTTHQTYLMLKAMRLYGGGFVQALAEAWRCADENNQLRLASAFPDYVKDYGPESLFYQAVAARIPK